MNRTLYMTLLLGTMACSTSPRSESEEQSAAADAPQWDRPDLAMVDDNVRHDTLLIQVTFALPDSTFLMVASHVNETFEGSRLYHYRALPDSSARILAVSSPAYDSWTMLPTVFRAPDDPEHMLILANFGEKQSWGQKVMHLGKDGFKDLGFLDVADPKRMVEPDTNYLLLRNAGLSATAAGDLNDLVIRFTGDSLYLYDDLRGHRDVVVPARSIAYRITAGKVLLVVDDEPREVLPPA